jgi:hypothetical protein
MMGCGKDQLRDKNPRKAERARTSRGLVVAETGADGDLVAALSAPTAQHGCARLGLHAGKKPVGLRAVAAVGLESTLRHWTGLLLNLSLLRYATVIQYTLCPRYSQSGKQSKGVTKASIRSTSKREKRGWDADKIDPASDLHKEWCNKKNVIQSLEIDLVFRATIKPAY